MHFFVHPREFARCIGRKREVQLFFMGVSHLIRDFGLSLNREIQYFTLPQLVAQLDLSYAALSTAKAVVRTEKWSETTSSTSPSTIIVLMVYLLSMLIIRYD